MTESLKQSVERVLREYPAARSQPLKDHPLARFIRTELPALVGEHLKGRLETTRYIVNGTKFLGSWAYVPWFSVLDRRITDSNQRGIYFVCLFSEDGTSILLAVGEGVTETNQRRLAEDREKILSAVALPTGFRSGPAQTGTLGQSSSARSYEQGLVCYKLYARDSIPSDDSLLDDMQSALAFVQKVADSPIFASLSFSQSPVPSTPQSVSLHDVLITPTGIKKAFADTTAADWQGRLGVDPYWMIEIHGERKPLKAVIRKIDDALQASDFTTHEAARAVRALGFQVINERDEEDATNQKSIRFWLYAPGRDAERWPDVQSQGEITIGWDDIGDLNVYTSMDQITEALKKAYGTEDSEPTNDARCNWEFSHAIQPGDVIYARRGRTQLIGVGEVTGPYRWDSSRSDHRSAIPVRWIKVGTWRLPEGTLFPIKTLTNITPYSDLVAMLNGLAGVEERPATTAVGGGSELLETAPIYTLDMLASKTGHPIPWLQRVIGRLQRKKHLLLQGPPGTGKTYLARELANHVTGGTQGFSELVQFHPSYSYEDFVQGLKPRATGGGIEFELVPGRFLRFCKRAIERSPAPAVLIIDEFNRANLSRVFGELMYLLEYRGEEVPLAAGGKPFSIPENVRIIATMNTADRSIALVDHALRRRFSFAFIGPDYEILKRHLLAIGLPTAGLIEALRQVNLAINDRNYEVGISFFFSAGPKLRQELGEIWEGEIEPYLDDFFYDQPEKAEALRWSSLRKTVLAEWD